MNGEYGLGEVVTGGVLPMRAEPGAPDTLNTDFADTLHEAMQDPWSVLPPEEWTGRYHDPTFAEALQTADPAFVRKMAVESFTALARARTRVARNAARRAGKRIK